MVQSSKTWNDFYNIVIEKEGVNWKIWKQAEDKSVFLQDKRDGMSWIMNKDWEEKAYHSMAQQATGDILLAGLGIGYEAYFNNFRSDVNSIKVVEKEQEIIDINTYTNHSKVSIVNDKISNYLSTTNEKFDVVYFDIFPANPVEFPNEVQILTDLSQGVLKPGGKIMFWNLYRPLDL